MNSLYEHPVMAAINIIGFWMEAFLSCYLLAHFFPPLSEKEPSVLELLGVSALITAALLGIDLVGLYVLSLGEPDNGRLYMAALVLLPLLYACGRLKGSLPMKLLLCFLFLMLNMLLESIFVAFQYPGMGRLERLLFRRILCKPLLYLIIRFLLRGGSRSQIQISNAYWISFAIICASEYLIIPPLMSDPQKSMSFKLLMIAACLFILLSFYIGITRIMDVMEKNRVYLSQNRQLELSQQYLTQVEGLSESLRTFRHDYKAHLFCMDALLSQGKYDELHQYLMKLHQVSLQTPDIVQYTLNVPLNIVLNQKAGEAQRQGISFHLNVVCPEQSRIQDMDLVALVSNLLDNALEAAALTPSPEVTLDIRQEKAYLWVEVVNTTDGDVLKRNPSLNTTKTDQEAHGLGLKIVRKIVERYDGMYQVSGDGQSLRTVALLRTE